MKDLTVLLIVYYTLKQKVIKMIYIIFYLSCNILPIKPFFPELVTVIVMKRCLDISSLLHEVAMHVHPMCM